MKLSLLRLLLAALIACNLYSCTNKNVVRVKTRNFDQEIDLRQNLVFTFDKDMVSDSLLSRWDSTALIVFTPPVNGSFKWNTKKELMFSPFTGFKPATEYKAILTDKILSTQLKQFQLQENREYLFHTPFLSLTGARGYWSQSAQSNDAAQLLVYLDFNYKVDPQLLKSQMTIQADEKQQSFNMVGTDTGDQLCASIEGFSRNNLKNLKLKITLKKGMRSVESDHKSTEAEVKEIEVPLPDRLAITEATGEYSGTEALIHVFTNQAVDNANIANLVKITPKLNTAVDIANDGFYIKGSFDPAITYQLIISKSMKGLLGGALEEDYMANIPFGQLAPSISFTNSKGMYLSSKGSLNVGINVVSIPEVNVKVTKIYENNIMAYLGENRYNDYEYYEDGEENYGYYSYNDYGLDKYGDVVLERKYETKNLPKSRGINLLNLSLDENNKNFKGVYLVRISSTEDNWMRAMKLVAISDVGLITKETDDEIYVFANSIKTTQPVAGATINFISSNNQVLQTLTTDNNGVAVFSNIKSRVPGFNVEMITARIGGDFTYLKFRDSKIQNSRFDVGGRIDNPGGYMAFMYGDRDIYRPGETIYLNTIVRNDEWMPASELPVKIKLLLPNGRDFKVMRQKLNGQGAYATAIALPSSAVTGFYIAEVYTANDVLLNSRNISVEEFMPDRIDVKLNVDKEDYSLSDTIKSAIHAFNLFGPPAANRKYESEFSLARKYFCAKDYPGYNFGIHLDKESAIAKVVREGKTNDMGTASEKFAMDAALSGTGVLQGKVFATVFDETGRPVNRVKSFDVFTQAAFYGMKMNDYYATRGQTMIIPFIVTDKNGKSLNADAEVQVIRHEWYSVLEQANDGRYHYASHKKERTLLDTEIKVSAKGYSFQYIPNESGEYEIRLMKPGSEHYVSSTFYAYGYGYTQNTSFQVNTEGEITIKTDKEKYAVGDNAQLLFTTPFAGRLLVTIECNKVIDYYYLNTDKRSAILNISMKETYLPNVYVTATLFKPLDDGSIPLTVAHGFAPLLVEKLSNHIPLTILAAEKSRSNTKQTIKIKAEARASVELTIAVVDEGILQIKNYKTPDPYDFFYQKRALQVNAYDVYPSLLPDLRLRRSSPGGDGYDLEKRVNPLTNKRIELVAFWSGILKTNSNGEASYTINIPQFSGDLRIMACAYNNQSFGSADKHMKVADPIVISPSVPRFFSPGDTLDMPITISNTTDAATKAIIKINTSGLVKLAGKPEQELSINGKGEARAYFRLAADKGMGNGSISVNVNALNEIFSDKTEITVRPFTSLIKISDVGSIKGGETKILEATTNFIPSSVDGKLLISTSPIVQFTDQLSYLLDYPHGCVEQTTSIAFPQIYYMDLIKSIKNKPKVFFDPAYNVNEAIRKLESMQLYNGALSYWPGGILESWWGTTYALHFLCEAQKAGFDVNDNVKDRIFQYISSKVKARETEYYYYWDEKNIFHNATRAKEESIYSLYLMALYGHPDLSSMNYYKSNTGLLTLDSKYMLAAAYLALGDQKSFYALVPKSFEGEIPKRMTGGSFASPVRDMAIALNVLLETNPDDTQIPELVHHLSQQIKKERWMSTQDRAWSFLALGKFMKQNSGSTVSAVVSAEGKKIGTFNNSKDLVLGKEIAGKKVEIKTNGQGNLYYFSETEGLSADSKVKEEDNYIRARKTFYNRFGQAITSGKFKQGDLVAVRLSVVTLDASIVSNVVITDMLPAGFEIENPRIGEVQEMDWIKNESIPEHYDIRDDRINLFSEVNGKEKNFYYLVRAVSTGTFKMGPVSADAMYNGEYHSYNGSGTILIEE